MDTSNINIGDIFNELRVTSIIDNTHLLCECSCGNITAVHIDNLVNGDIMSCGHIVNTPLNITGMYFGKWFVDSYAGSRQWNVICKCGEKAIKDGGKLRNGYTKSCKKCARLVDLKGEVFGELEVLEYIGNRKWRCKCSCKNIIEVAGGDLKNGHTKSCGHNTTAFKDLTGKTFGELTAKRFLGYGMWECKCSCTNTVNVHRTRLLNGSSKSCGCKSDTFRKTTMFERYGDIHSSKVGEAREVYQIEALLNKDKLTQIIKSFGIKPDIAQLCMELNVQKSALLKAIHRFGLEEVVAIGSNVSRYEHEIVDLLYKMDASLRIETSNREMLGGGELDIYIPDKNLALEFNGNIYHSTIYKERKYHQNKTLQCRKLGIHLLHIFEYEWNDTVTRQKIINIIEDKIIGGRRIYGRETVVKEIGHEESKQFIDRYHLQNYTQAAIHTGTFLDGQLIGVMALGKPRFSTEEYEIIRLAYRNGIIPVGCTRKMFEYFVHKYNPSSIISYANAAKFSGNTYKSLGFRLDGITSPNYVWVKEDKNNTVLTRYQTQKDKLVQAGLGNKDETEDEIMYRLGYYKIYDAGNYRYIWNTLI